MGKKEKPYFKSAFLNEQLRIGNISRHPLTDGITLLDSFNFKEVLYDDRHKHRDKITAALRKEGFLYAGILFGYVRPEI